MAWRHVLSVVGVLLCCGAGSNGEAFRSVAESLCQRNAFSEAYFRDTGVRVVGPGRGNVTGEEGGIRDGGKTLKFFWYDLPTEFHRDLIEFWTRKSVSHRYYCDPGCKLCDDRSWGTRGADMVIRQNGGGIALMAKLSQLPSVDRPEEADFFIVPALNHLMYNAGWSWLMGANASRQLRLFDYLTHYSRDTAHKHVFFTGDDPATHLLIRTQPVVVHMGPRVPLPVIPAGQDRTKCVPGRPWHVVIPDPQITTFTQPKNYVFNRHRPIFVFYFGAVLKHIPIRQQVLDDVLRYQRLGVGEEREFARAHGRNLTDEERAMRVYNITVHRILKVRAKGRSYARHLALQQAAKQHPKPLRVRQMFNASKFCPILSGDIPHQTRFFEAIHHGCLPVVITYAAGTAEESWWRDPHNVTLASSFKGTDPNMPGRVNDSIPFADLIPYPEFVVAVPYATFLKEGIMPTLVGMPDADYLRRVEAMLEHRSKLTYDFDSHRVDVFSMFLRQLHRVKLESQKATAPRAFGMKGIVPCSAVPADDAGGIPFGRATLTEAEKALESMFANRSFKSVPAGNPSARVALVPDPAAAGGGDGRGGSTFIILVDDGFSEDLRILRHLLPCLVGLAVLALLNMRRWRSRPAHAHH